MNKIKITIKITDDDTWTDACPLEFSIEDAKRLYEELKKVFEGK